MYIAGRDMAGVAIESRQGKIPLHPTFSAFWTKELMISCEWQLTGKQC